MIRTIRNHVSHLHHEIDDRSLPVRVGITVGALLALPLLGTAVRTLGSALGLGAHIPAARRGPRPGCSRTDRALVYRV
ncbi:hypothetical protein [Haloarcula halophila]|uniref:hypothetical protein n=1 Tax=Haloarcula halophila TaxID=3032584 RepID=UPI0023E4348C|nr:hypothetical protein [Halomicroarcula sp. DFY41]